jgi:hypothetical protein
MTEVESAELQQAGEDLHHCRARLAQSVSVSESFKRRTVLGWHDARI